VKKLIHPAILFFSLFILVLPLRALELENIEITKLSTIEIPTPLQNKSMKEWTILIYVSARNNLGLEAIKDVNEMEAAGSSNKINVVVEMGRMECDPPFNPFADPEPLPPQADWTGSRRFII
jgi:hypothetical protein